MGGNIRRLSPPLRGGGDWEGGRRYTAAQVEGRGGGVRTGSRRRPRVVWNGGQGGGRLGRKTEDVGAGATGGTGGQGKATGAKKGE